MTRRTYARPLLATALRLDAVASGAMGALLALAAGVLAAPLGLPEPLLRAAGLILLPYGAVVAYVGTRPAISRGAVIGVVAANALWVVASILLLVGSWVAPTALGYAFVIAQALVVFAFAEAQWVGLRRATRSTAIA